MARSGWVKFKREWLDNPAIAKDPDTLAVWLYLLCNAAFEPTPGTFGGKSITLQPGQLTSGRNQIATATGVEPSKVKRTTKCFKTAHLIDQQVSNKNSLFSILCGDFSHDCDQQNDQQMTSRMTTLEESKELRNTRSKRSAPVFEQSSNAYRAATWLSQSILEASPSTKPHDEQTLQRWAYDLDKLNRIDGYAWELISDVLDYARNDSFWRGNILSGAKYRKQFPTLLARYEGGDKQ